MSVVTTQIEFENENRIFYSGQLVKGRLTLTIAEEKLVRGIYIHVHGFGHCEFIFYAGNIRNKTEGNETYVDERIYVVGSEEAGTTDICIAPGTYAYPFECQLPIEVPSSFESDIGSIKYIAKCVLDRPSWPIPTPDFPFTVYKPVDLTSDFTIHEPLTQEMDQRFNVCCLICCWESRPLHMAVTIPKCGFIPNETIKVDVDVKNPSSEDVSDFRIQIVQTVVASANDGKQLTDEGTERSETKDVVVLEQTADGLLCGDERKFEIKIIVPSTAPSDITSSAIFKISHTLRIVAVVGLCHEDVIFNIPIKIGTDYGRRSNALYASGRGRVPIVMQPTAPPNDGGVTEPLLSKKGQSNSKTVQYISNPPTYEEATSSFKSKN